MKVIPIVILAIAAILGGVNARPNNKIVGGEPVDIEEFPYQVSLQFLDSHFCGGSIIGKREIVTAAHCTDGMMPKYLSVRAGSTYHLYGGQVIKVAEVKQHPQYNKGTMDYDISVVILENDIEFSKSTQPIALPAEGTVYPDLTSSVVTGWGTLWASGPTPVHLQAVVLPLISRNTCQEAYPGENITARMICAGFLGTGGKDACQGDSGGPLEAEGKLIGVVSWGYGCADKDHPGIYADVSNLRSFIKENTGI